MTGYMIKRAVINKGMILAWIIPLLMLYYELLVGQGWLAHLLNGAELGNGLNRLLNVYALSAYIIFAGMFPGIPYGFSLLEERNSGYLRYILQRISAKKFIRTKVFVTGVSGAFSTLIPYLVFVIPLAILTRHDTGTPFVGQEELIWYTIAQSGGAFMVYLLKGVLLVLFGIMWAELTLLLTLYIKNQYIAFVLPVVIFQLFWLIFPWRSWNPVFLIRADFTGNEISPGWPFFVFLLYIAIVIVGILFGFGRQVKNERI